MTNKEMEKKVQDLQELKRMRDELNDEISAIECELKAEMTTQAKDEVIVGPFKVTYKTTNGTKFNSAEFKKDHPDLNEKYTIPNPYKSLRIY